ncbi:MAG: twin-arginine translocase TatA/TatE family subunit [Bdellovibrionales bacterium]|nr:twin-arginine translocase TatA/TatE family subunit [Bdellovibrionales bacterium]
MFNLGFSEMVLLSVLALIFIGPKQLPELARVVGRLLNEFKRATGELTSSFTDIKHQADRFVHKTEDQVRQQLSIDKLDKEDMAPPGGDGSFDSLKVEPETSSEDSKPIEANKPKYE